MAIAKALALSVTLSLSAFQASPLRLLKTCSVLIGFWIAPSAITSAQGIAPVVPEHSFSQPQLHTQQIVQSDHHNPPEVTSFVLSAFESDFSPSYGSLQDILYLGVSPSSRYITALTRISKRVDDRQVETRSTQIWDIENNWEVSRLFQSERLIPQYLSPNGRYLFTTKEDQEAIQIWDIEEDQEVFNLQDRFCELSGFSSNNRYFVTLRLLEEADNGEFNSEIRIWDFIANQQVAHVPLSSSQSMNCGQHSTGEIQVSSNNQYIALELDNHSSIDASIENATIIIWDLESNQEIVKIQQDFDNSFENRFSSISFSPSSQYVAAAAEDGTVQVWDLQIREEVARITQPQNLYAGEARTVSFSSDSRYILSKNISAVSMWDIKSKQALIETPVQADVVYLNGQFNEDGQNLVVHGIRNINRYGESKLFMSSWNIETGQQISHIEISRAESSLYDIEFSYDGRYISTRGRLSTAILNSKTLDFIFNSQIDPASIDDGFRNSFYSFDSQYFLTVKSVCNLNPCLDYGVEDQSTVVQLWKLP